MSIYSEVESNDTASENATMTTTTSSLPPEARNLNWKDSFYNGQQDIIAVFDYLPNKPCQRVVLHEVTIWLFLALTVSAMFLLLALSGYNPEELRITFMILGCVAFAFPLMVGLILGIVRQSRFRNLHFCVTSEGLRVDKEDAGSYTVIPFEHIIVDQESLTGNENRALRNLWDHQVGFLIPQSARDSFGGSSRQVWRYWMSFSLCGIEQPQEFGRLVLALREKNQRPEHMPTRTPAAPPVVDAPSSTSLQLNGQTHVLTWNDRYYDEKPDIVAVFDVDLEKAKRQLARRRVGNLTVMFTLPVCLVLAWIILDPASALIWFNAAGIFLLGLLKCSQVVKQIMAEQTASAEHMALTETGVRRDDMNSTYTVTYWEKVQCRLHVYRPTWWYLPCRVLFSQAFPGIEEEYVSWPWTADNGRQFVEVVTAMKNRAPGIEKAGGPSGMAISSTAA